MRRKIAEVVGIDEEKCLLCNKCIKVCPVDCNIAEYGKKVHIKNDECIGCGQCIEVCSHRARYIIDDMSEFIKNIANNDKMVAIIAPAVVAQFPKQYLKINDWLKSVGVKACFDVSFGAELTVKSYIEYIRKEKPKCVIAQPCPAIVTYIQIYRPELLKYLAPVDSPMMHTIKMIKKYYPKYSNAKFVVISPCIAKKHEFEEVGVTAYNVTMINLQKYFDKNKIDITSYHDVDYDNPSAERAVLFSTPGGLLRTIQRTIPEAGEFTRKIEGVHEVYPYLDNLEKAIKSNVAPVLIDILNCSMGCNGGTGTNHKHGACDLLIIL